MTATASAPANRMLLTARETAAALALSERTLWSMTKAGEICHVKAGRRILYAPADLAAWIDKQRTNGPAPRK